MLRSVFSFFVFSCVNFTNSQSNTPSRTPTLLPQSPETPPAKTAYPYIDAEYKQSLLIQSPPPQSPPASPHENPESKTAAYARSLPPSSSTRSRIRESTVTLSQLKIRRPTATPQIPSKFLRPAKPPAPPKTRPSFCVSQTLPQKAAPASTPTHPSIPRVPAAPPATKTISCARRPRILSRQPSDVSLPGCRRSVCAYVLHPLACSVMPSSKHPSSAQSPADKTAAPQAPSFPPAVARRSPLTAESATSASAPETPSRSPAGSAEYDPQTSAETFPAIDPDAAPLPPASPQTSSPSKETSRAAHPRTRHKSVRLPPPTRSPAPGFPSRSNP